MTKRLLAMVGLIALVSGNAALTVWAQHRVNVFAGIAYRFPTTVGATGTFLINDGSGNLSWAGVAVPQNVIAYSTNGVCPAGWSEYTTGRGRYVVGLVAGGTSEATVGTALSNAENRATGQHNHVASGTHTHTQTAHGHTVTNPSHFHAEPASSFLTGDSGGTSVPTAGGSTSTGTSTTGVSIAATAATNAAATTGIAVNNTGSVSGTNAPYIQMLVCRKN